VPDARVRLYAISRKDRREAPFQPESALVAMTSTRDQLLIDASSDVDSAAKLWLDAGIASRKALAYEEERRRIFSNALTKFVEIRDLQRTPHCPADERVSPTRDS
jgi:hypothetical protein